MRLGQKVVLNASALGAGRLATAAIGVVSIGIGTRYLGLEGYGQLATALAFMGIVLALTDLGIWTIGIRELARRPDQTDRLLGALLTVGFVIALMGSAAAVGTAFLLYGGSDDDLALQAIVWLMLTAPFAAPVGAINAFFTAQQKAYVGVIATMAGSVTTLALLVSAVTLDWGFSGVVLAYLLANVVQAVTLCAIAYGKVSLRPSFDRALIRELLGYAMPVGGSQVAGALYMRIDIVLLSLLAPASEVALYAVVFRVVDMLLILPHYMHVTVMPELARVARTRERFAEVMQKTLNVIVVGALGVLILSFAFASELIELVAGSDFGGAVPILQILSLVVGIGYLVGIFGDAFLVHDRQKAMFKIALLVLPVNIVLNLLLIPLWQGRGAAAAWVLSELFLLIAYGVLFRRLFGALPRLRRGLHVLAAAGAMAAVAMLKLLPPVAELDPLVVVGLGGALSTVVYVGSLYALNAMPSELHTNLLMPLWSRVKLGHGSLKGIS